MSENDQNKIDQEAKEYHSAYAEGSRMFRTWLIAYGVGGPVLFLTQGGICLKIINSGEAAMIVYLFLFGVFLQVMIALINKWINWILYAYADSSERKSSIKEEIYGFADIVSEQFWLDIAADLGSILAFGLATLKVLLICVGAQS